MTPGATNKKQIAKVLGSPKKITNLKNFPESKETGELWEYIESGMTRLSISFESSNEILQGWAWSVPEGASEQNLKAALKQFPGASWEVETVKWVNPHHMPNECYFKDKKLGISIQYDKARNEVSYISRWNPSRMPSSDNDEKPPQFCIGDQCVNGISGKEWAKTWPLCKVPK